MVAFENVLTLIRLGFFRVDFSVLGLMTKGLLFPRIMSDILVVNVNVSGFGISLKYHLSRNSKTIFFNRKGKVSVKNLVLSHFNPEEWPNLLLITRYLLLFTCYWLFSTHYSLIFTRFLSLFNRYLLPSTFHSLLLLL